MTIAVDRESLLRAAMGRFRLPVAGVHGVAHWLRVEALGHWLAAETGADPAFVTLFAFLHDVERLSEEMDPQHGPRAGAFVRTVAGTWFRCPPDDLDRLAVACRDHSTGTAHPDPTVRTCWDADRLDLWRFGIEPRPERLLTLQARRPDTIRAAREFFERNPRFTPAPPPGSGPDTTGRPGSGAG